MKKSRKKEIRRAVRAAFSHATHRMLSADHRTFLEAIERGAERAVKQALKNEKKVV